MSALTRKSEEIVVQLSGAGYGFDPTTIVAIITSLIQLFKGCNLTAIQAEKRADNPRLLDRLVLRRVIRQHSNGEDEDALHAALLDAGQETTVTEMKALYAEVS